MPKYRGVGKLSDSETAVYHLMREMGIKPPREKVHQLTSRLEGLEYGAMKKDNKHDGTPPFVDTVREATALVASLPRDPVLAYREYMTRYVVDGSAAMKYFHLLNVYDDLARRFGNGTPEAASKIQKILHYLESRGFREAHLTDLLILANLICHGDEFYSSVGDRLLRGIEICCFGGRGRRRGCPSDLPNVIYEFDRFIFRQLLSGLFWQRWPHADMSHIADFPDQELSALRLNSATPEEWNRYMMPGLTNEGLPVFVWGLRDEMVIGEDEQVPILAFLPPHELSPLMARAMIDQHNVIPLWLREMRRKNDLRWAPFLAEQQAGLDVLSRVAELEEGAPERYPGELQRLRESLQSQGGRNNGNGGPRGSSTPASRVLRSRHAQDVRTRAPTRSRRPAAAHRGPMRTAGRTARTHIA